MTADASNGVYGSSAFAPSDRARLRFAERGFREWGAFLVVVLGFCGSIIYTNLHTYTAELASTVGYSDSREYVNMYHGEPATGLRSYRPLVPFLARFVPPPPASLYDVGHRSSQLATVAVRFAILNLFFLIGACVLLVIYQEGFGMGRRTAFLGVLLFLGTQTVVVTSGVPMVDAAFFFFFLLCLISVQRGNVWLLLVALTVGVMAKELVLLTIPMILLSTAPLRSKALMLAASVPSIVVFGLVVANSGNALTGSSVQPDVGALATLNSAYNLFIAFGLAWIPAAYALLRVDVPPLLRRWAWLLPLVLIIVFLSHASWSRNVFTAFPAVIPLAALGLAEWMRRGIPSSPQAEPSPETG